MAVVDTGIGIKDEEQSSLFKLFGFLDTTKELNTRGIGLGLHISRMIVQQLGGDIICNSKWQKGSTFVFLLSLDVQTMSNETNDNRCRNPTRRDINYPKIKINQS